MLAKVKECRDAIKNLVAFDRLQNDSKTVQSVGSNSSMLVHKTPASSVPDIITFSSIALKHKDYGDDDIVMRSSTKNLNEADKRNASIKQNEDAEYINHSLNRFLLADDTVDSSLKSFLALEKQIEDEFMKDDSVFTVKKKISAEPFLSYVEGSAEFVWLDETTEDSISDKTTEDTVSNKTWQSMEDLTSSDIDFDKPRTSSSFYETSRITKKNRTSSPIRSFVLQDISFDTNYTI